MDDVSFSPKFVWTHNPTWAHLYTDKLRVAQPDKLKFIADR